MTRVEDERTAHRPPDTPSGPAPLKHLVYAILLMAGLAVVIFLLLGDSWGRWFS